MHCRLKWYQSMLYCYSCWGGPFTEPACHLRMMELERIHSRCMAKGDERLYWCCLMELRHETCWLTMLTVDLHDPDRRSSCLKSLVPFLFLFLSTTLEDLLYVCWSGGLTMINSCLLPPSVETNHMATACFPVSVVSFHNLPWTEQLPKRLKRQWNEITTLLGLTTRPYHVLFCWKPEGRP